MDAVSQSLSERTGRSLEEWCALVEHHAQESDADLLDQKAVRAWLRDEHGLRQNSQWTVADAVARRAGWSPPSLEELTAAMYAGKKAVLRPLHDAVVQAVIGLGGVEAQGRASYIPLVRHRQLAAVGPGTYGRLRVGLRLSQEVPEDERLEPARGFAQATHVVHVPAPGAPGSLAPEDLVVSLMPLLQAAWEQN